jgi:hypothetical protein
MAATYDYLADKHGYDARLKDRAFETAFDQLVSDVRALAAVGPEDRAIRDALQATGLQVYDTATYIEDEPEEPVQM